MIVKALKKCISLLEDVFKLKAGLKMTVRDYKNF